MFRAAGLRPNLVRIVAIRDDAITSFAITGNRMLIRTDRAWTSRVLRRGHDRCC